MHQGLLGAPPRQTALVLGHGASLDRRRRRGRRRSQRRGTGESEGARVRELLCGAIYSCNKKRTFFDFVTGIATSATRRGQGPPAFLLRRRPSSSSVRFSLPLLLLARRCLSAALRISICPGSAPVAARSAAVSRCPRRPQLSFLSFLPSTIAHARPVAA
jgi:hypothetical protein